MDKRFIFFQYSTSGYASTQQLNEQKNEWTVDESTPPPTPMPFVSVKRESNLPPVDLIAVDLIGQLKRGLHAVLRVSLGGERGELLQAREEPRHGSVVLVAAEDVDGAVKFVRVTSGVHHFGETAEGL